MHHAISACSQALFGNESKRNREGYATSLKFLKPWITFSSCSLRLCGEYGTKSRLIM